MRILFVAAACVAIVWAQTMTERDEEYLTAHNSRRKIYHEENDKKYIPLKWDTSLKNDAMVWAKRSLEYCGTTRGMRHSDSQYGENVSANYGTGSWGKLPTPDKVLWKFVDREESWPYPKNSHLVQVIWRGTKYVGCAEAKEIKDGKTCHVQVCRYAPPAMCGMERFKPADVEKNPTWWMKPMLEDSHRCTPACPREARNDCVAPTFLTRRPTRRKQPTRRPTRKPIKRPTRKPTKRPTRKPTRRQSCTGMSDTAPKTKCENWVKWCLTKEEVRQRCPKSCCDDRSNKRENQPTNSSSALSPSETVVLSGAVTGAEPALRMVLSTAAVVVTLLFVAM